MPGGGGGTKRIRAARVIFLSVLYTDRNMPTTHSSRSKTCNAYAKRFQQLKADLAQIEYFSKGTLLARMVRCGKPQCACAKDPSKRHGPYYEWTYKARGKTVTVLCNRAACPRSSALVSRRCQTIPQAQNDPKPDG